MLESIVNQTKLLTSAQLSVGSGPSYIATLEGAIYVANSGSNTVSVIDPNTNTVIKLKHMKLGTIVLLPIVKNALLSFVPGIFALLIAIFGFINNDTVGKITEFNIQNIFTLFALGVGIESTKLLFDRVKLDTTLK